MIVVGSGSGGAATARRLIDAGMSVLVPEAGGADTSEAIHVPARVHELWFGEEDWAYHTVPQEHAAGRRMHRPRGRVSGGSSALNGMIHVRGAAADFDAWAYRGNDGWRWQDVLPPPSRWAAESHLFWHSRPGLPVPDIQPIHFNVPAYEPWLEGPPNGFTLLGGLVRPASRGRIRLRSTDPRVLSVEADVAALQAAVEQYRRMGAALQAAVEPCRRMGARRVGRARSSTGAPRSRRRTACATTCAAP